jgi:hypothetical protein
MLIRNLIVCMLVLVALTLTGCFSTGDQAPIAESDAVATPTRITPTPSPSPEPTVAESNGLPAGTESPSDVPPASPLTVEAAQEIQNYRFRISTRSESERGQDVVEIDGAVIKEPPAEQIAATFQQGERTQEIEMLLVGGIRYLRTGDTWMQTPDTVLNFEELTLITPRAVVGLLAQMERVAVETVAGRPAIHYRGGKELIPVVGEPGDQMDVSQLEFAQLDLWIDEAENVITKLVLEASGSEAENSARVIAVFEYFDFNSDIVIEPPLATSTGTTAETVATEPATTELGRLVGFNLLIPTGTTVEGIVGANMLVATTPYTFDEAQRFVEQNMVDNGYTMVTKVGPAESQIVYLFQNGAKVLNVTIVPAEGQMTRIQFAASQ